MIRFDASTLVDGDAVAYFARRVFGDDVATARGVLHPAAVWDGPNGPRVLRIGPHSPKSEADLFFLHLARARADVIVTTGEILRSEPGLSHDLGVRAGFADALLDFRRRHVGAAARARVVVLTRGDVDLAHPGLHGWAEPWLFVPASAAPDLDDRAATHGVRVRRFEHLDLDRAIDALLDDGARTISIEAGVATTAPRYERGVGFDELLLSHFVEPAIDARAIGARFPELVVRERIYGPPRRTFGIHEASGLWRFERFMRIVID